MATTIQPQTISLGMPAADNANLFLFKDLDDPVRTSGLAEADLSALRSVAEWTRRFIIQPHDELGRPGPICPFTPVALDNDALWLAPEHSRGRTPAETSALIESYKRMLLDHAPVDGEIAALKAIVVVFPDLPVAEAKQFLEATLQPIAIPSYVNDGLVMGPFFEGNDGTAIYNPNFRPFTAPVPSLLMRRAVASDWKFFLNDPDWFKLWARRYGEAGTSALAEELRTLPWNRKPN